LAITLNDCFPLDRMTETNRSHLINVSFAGLVATSGHG
jgi:hypothetical protein